MKAKIKVIIISIIALVVMMPAFYGSILAGYDILQNQQEINTIYGYLISFLILMIPVGIVYALIYNMFERIKEIEEEKDDINKY